MKTTGDLELWARRLAVRYLVGVIGAMVVVSIWTLFLGRHIQDRWFAWPNILFLAPLPIATALAAYGIYRSLQDGGHVRPFLLSIALFLLGFVGLAISLFPYLVPPALTIWQVANTVDSQLFLIAGFSVAIVMTFLYTAYSYWVFRGKVAEDIQAAGYH